MIEFKNQKLTKLDSLLLYSIVRGFRPDRVLEIGRSYGTSTMTICGALCDNDRGHLDSVDIKDNTSTDIKNLVAGWATEYLVDSNDLLAHDEIKDKKYQMFFVDGDHSIFQQVKDIETCVRLGAQNFWIILHDADLPETPEAVNLACQKYPLIDNGRFGDQLHLLKNIPV